MKGIYAVVLLKRAAILRNVFFPFVGNRSVGDTLGSCSVAFRTVCLAPQRHGLIFSRGWGTRKPGRTGSSGASPSSTRRLSGPSLTYLMNSSYTMSYMILH